MILLKNVQKIHKICRPEVKAQLEMMLTAAGYKGWDVGVSLSGDRTVKKLNNEYRGKNRSTDILSFRFAEVTILPHTEAPFFSFICQSFAHAYLA